MVRVSGEHEAPAHPHVMRVLVEGGRASVRFRIDDTEVFVEGEGVVANGDAALALTLLPAMADHVDLSIGAAVSPALLHNAAMIQDVFGCWRPGWRRVSVEARAASTARRADGGRTGAFFSGGVDSFDCVRAHAGEIDALVYVEGFDVPLADESLRSQVRASLEAAARELSLPLVVLATDLRAWSDRSVPWGFFHGRLRRWVTAWSSSTPMLIPSTDAYDQLVPWGAHPLTDPLWSGSTRFVHAGAARNRLAKVAAIHDFDPAYSALRVCWKNPDGAYNCGRCRKCLTTMSYLAALGALDRFDCFPATLTAANILKVEDLDWPIYAEWARDALSKAGRSDLALAWAARLARHRLSRVAPVRGVRGVRRTLSGARGRRQRASGGRRPAATR